MAPPEKDRVAERRQGTKESLDTSPGPSGRFGVPRLGGPVRLGTHWRLGRANDG